jgi:hypothetical protein
MSSIIADLQQAFSVALNANPMAVLLPLVIVAVAQGLRADGVRDVFSMTTRGLLWFGIVAFLLGGLLQADRFSLDAWKARADSAWGTFLDLRFLEAMGFWLLLLAVIALIFSVRSVVRR